LLALSVVGAMSMAAHLDRSRACGLRVRDDVATRQPTPPPVTTLRTRDAEVAIYSIDGALRYSVLGRDARVLMHLGTQRAFATDFPVLAQHVEVAFADDRPWGDVR
jgi:hypothetical protein